MKKTRLTEEERRISHIQSSIKWKKLNPLRANEHRRNNYAKSRVNATNQRNEWTLKEINEILNSPLTDRELSAKLGRSVQTIQLKRYKCRKREA